MSADPQHLLNIRYVAAQVVANAATATALPVWENYMDIGEEDWHHVLREVTRMAAALAPASKTYTAAYKALTRRAGGEH
jgi:hypothetical protein